MYTYLNPFQSTNLLSFTLVQTTSFFNSYVPYSNYLVKWARLGQNKQNLD